MENPVVYNEDLFFSLYKHQESGAISWLFEVIWVSAFCLLWRVTSIFKAAEVLLSVAVGSWGRGVAKGSG